MITHTEAGRRIRSAREALNLSQTAAAQRIGMDRTQFNQLESGRRVPSWTRLVEIVTILGLNPKIVTPEFFPEESK